MYSRAKARNSIADFAVSRRKRKPNFLDKVDVVINWERISKFLNKKLNRKANVVGNPAYPALMMFKILLLQKWYRLSDPAMEEMLVDHLGFLRFIGLSVEQDVPDETTICRFRNGLVALNIIDKLNEMVLMELEKNKLFVKEGAIVDATIVESALRPRKTVDVIAKDREEDNIVEREEDSTTYDVSNEKNDDKVTTEISYSKDKDAAWLKKGNKAHYGYKHHAAVDSKEGYFLGGHTTPANKSDTGEFERLIDELQLSKGATVFADKGYTSTKNRNFLAQKGLDDAIMMRATKNKKLTEIENKINKYISKTRYKVERSFASFKKHFDLVRSRYIGIAKVEAEMFMVGIAFNLKKATRLITI